ncbi:MAG: bifunctional (p)ppGpp synthetase/guanosine-3',5'-bis(diphosphate) 3'-pyrophosphohydrolase [Defluviitaleaceae bacterium]|nr:bifunctional (p)ppGpp synthetase/guanosine-3',5'-bis(diphosphate) 3'-pyrophosphohydrolase [Defluviitaleaceae bacterium]
MSAAAHEIHETHETVEYIYKKFIEKLKSNGLEKDLPLIVKAYRMADSAHKGQKRKSGEPYIIHPVYVSIILCELGMDTESIIAGLLHDTIEDTSYTYEDIHKIFGEVVANLVLGVTKLLKIEYKKEGAKNEDLQAENYRKMFLATAGDLRIILIKMADRLHNMRTLNYMTPQKQRQKAQETMDIYAPLALRLGISTIRNELEDLSFRYLEPEEYYALAEKIQKKQDQRQILINDMVSELESKIKASSFMETHRCAFEIEGRPKHFFSIYKKMKSKNLQFDQIYDLFAVRIMVDTVMECYGILGSIHENYNPIPHRFKDYIAVAKSNGYQSIHTTIIGVNGEPFEIQIRTKDMHKVAEYGVAAHWKYKENPNTILDTDSEEAKLNISVRKILELHKELSDNEEYLEELKTELDIYKGSIYCYTPRGDLMELKEGSTPVDFAYSIHSAVGNNMVGAKVNNAIVTFDHKLVSGDRIEIITSGNSSGPKAEWLNFVQTSQARNRIKTYLKQISKTEHQALGKEYLEHEAKKRKTSLDELLTEARKETLLNRYNYTEWDLFVAAIGRRSINEEQVIKRLIAQKEKEEERARRLELQNVNINDANLDLSSMIGSVKKQKKSKSGVIIQGVGDAVVVRFSKCCSPLPGDEIIGFVTRGRGVTVHRTDCKNMIHISEDEKNRLREVYWDVEQMGKTANYTVDLTIEADDKAGILVDISAIMLESKTNIRNLSVRADGQNALIKCTLDVESKAHVDRLYQRLLAMKEIHNIQR